jgi:uncharacterized protein YjbI with pentapeptide repeats
MMSNPSRIRRLARAAAATACLLAAIALAFALIWPVTDLIAQHDVGSMKGIARAAQLPEAREAVRTQLLTLGAGVFAAGALVYTALNFRLSRHGQVTDRFTKSVQQLGSKKLDVRIGGIYAMEQIARDSRRYHPAVIEVLVTFTREHSHDQNNMASERAVRPDVQAAVTVIGRRNSSYDPGGMALFCDLHGANLANANLALGNFAVATLYDADLTRARFTDANLSGATLYNAILTGAYAVGANFAEAILTGAKVTAANFSGVDLSRALLIDADLSGTVLLDANLTNANLIRTNLTDAKLADAKLIDAQLSDANLTRANLKRARLRGAFLGGANLVSTSFLGADMSKTSLLGASIVGADFSGANLTGAMWPKEYPEPPGWTLADKHGQLKRTL